MMFTKNSGTSFWIISIIKFLPRNYQVYGVVIGILAILSGLSELISLSAVIPFLTAISSPENLLNNKFLLVIVSFFGINESKSLIISSAILFGLSTILASSLKLLTLWLTTKYTASIGVEIGSKMYSNTIKSPYCDIININSSHNISVSVNHLERTVNAINCFLQLCTSLITSLFLLSGIVYLEPAAAAIVVILLSTFYIGISSFAKRMLKSNSYKIAKSNKLLIKTIQESLQAIKQIIIDDLYSYFEFLYNDSLKTLKFCQASNRVIGTFPKYLLEALAISAIAAIGAIVSISATTPGSALQLLGVLALGSQKLIPSLQQVYGNWSNIQNYQSDLSQVYTELSNDFKKDSSYVEDENLTFNSNVSLQNVAYTYGENKNSLNDISLKIDRGEIVGITGLSGCGKTTLINIIMGLLIPSKGQIYIDNQIITEYNRRSWMKNISLVPQHTYLSDDTILSNIAFGIPLQNVDLERVEMCAEIACINDWIKSLPREYATTVGEMGDRLSGGQKQRIGIARALYKKANILVLDESTSSLDNSTEIRLMNKICRIKEKTIIIIAHRASTLEFCNKIISLKDGRIV